MKGGKFMMKRRIALFIILALLLSPVATFAAKPMTDIENNPHRNAIEEMVDLGVLSGRGDGLFYPDDNLTRAEAAKVAVFLAGISQEDVKQAEALPQAFNDVYLGMGKHQWALGWINLAVREGIIGGYGDGNYGPGDKLEMAQWAAILIRTIGYDTEKLEWPTGYDQLAHDLGLTEGLDYVSDSPIKRDQMARFTRNAVYNAEGPDGSRIIDLLKDRVEDRLEDQGVESINMSIELTPEALPEGGGQTAAITVTVTDMAGNPLEDAKVTFEAFAFESGERNTQLSEREIKTDASGKAVATYTSLAKDDKKMVGIDLAAFKDSAEDFRHCKIMAANQASVIEGQVKNPSTGEPEEGVHIHFMGNNTDKSVGFAETDSQGRYSMVVPTGTYQVTFEMALRDQKTVKASSPGQTYTADSKKGLLKGTVTGVSPGNLIMALAPDFKHSPDAWTLQAEIQSDGSFSLALAPKTYELFIVGRSNPFKKGITIKSGQVTDIGTVSGR